MTLDDFQQLCHDQWMNQDLRGDVAKLWLTDESAIELTASVLGAPDNAVDYQLGVISSGAFVSKVLNPVTRTAVMVTPGNPADTAFVNHGDHTPATLVSL
jgi:hypothetical protein